LRTHKAFVESRRLNASDFDLSIVWVTAVLPRACCVRAYVRVSRVRAHMSITAKGVDGKGGPEAEHWKRNCDDGCMDWAHWSV